MLFEKGSFLRQTGQRVEGRESKSWLVAGVRTEGAGVCDQTGATPREGVTEYFAVISQRRRLLLFTSVVGVWRLETLWSVHPSSGCSSCSSNEIISCQLSSG